MFTTPSPTSVPCEEEEISGCAPAGFFAKPNLNLISFSLRDRIRQGFPTQPSRVTYLHLNPTAIFKVPTVWALLLQ